MARILVIEDNPTNLQLMVYLLQAFGHSTIEAMDGETGLAAARCGPPDLILCDVDLPKMDGLQVARALKLDPVLGAIPLVAVTALAMVGGRERMLQEGFDGYIPKPIQPREFVGQVEQYLSPESRSPARSEEASAAPEKAAVPAAVPAAVAAPDAAPVPPRARVLVVDDTPMNLRLARCILEPHGYITILAQTAAEAMALARSEPPDLILSDVHMPGTDGFDLLAALQAEPGLREVPFAFLSATYLRPADERRAGTGGAIAFLQRPLSAQRLLAEVAALLEKARSRRGGE